MDHCPETRNRIRVSLAAWAYEVHNDALLPDHLFDRLALSIDVRKSTARPDLDEWFRDNFSPHTGIWVLNHPERDKIESLYQALRNPPREESDGLTRWEIFLGRVLGSLTT